MHTQLVRERLLEAWRLKALPRAGWLRVGVAQPESVAAHSWGVAALTLLLCPAELDRGRALALAVLHDLAEVRTGDLTPHDHVPPADKRRAEREALRGLTAGLPAAGELLALFDEHAAGRTPEARFVAACDKLDLALQAEIYRREQHADTAEFIDSALAALADHDLAVLIGRRKPA